MIKIAICDDDAKYSNELSELLKVFAEQSKIEVCVDYFTSGKSLLFHWEDSFRYADILYLDIGMPDMNGMEVAEKLRSIGYQNEIIFCTRSDTKMLEAFDVSAFHYIVKEVTEIKKQEEIFRRAAEKAKERQKEFIAFNCAGEIRNVVIRDILYFRVDKRIITVYYEPDKTFEFYTSLGKLEDVVCQKGFMRISRDTIINLLHVKSHTSQELIMKDGERIQIGRVYRKDVKEVLAAYSEEVIM